MEVMLPPELLEEILFRVPPDEPAYLIRAALVCKLWRRIILSSDDDGRGFLRRYRAFHRIPPLLGYLHNLYSFPGRIPRFVHTSGGGFRSRWPPFSQRPPLDCRYRWVLDCRNGRVLSRTFEPDSLVIWDPAAMTTSGGGGGQGQPHVTMSVPAFPDSLCTGAVLCAAHANGCDHHGCRNAPSIVVFAGSDEDGTTRVSVHSPKTRSWGTTTSIVHAGGDFIWNTPGDSVLVGGVLYLGLTGGKNILRYSLAEHQLSLIDTPRVFQDKVMIKTEDGRLGFVALLHIRLDMASSSRRRWRQ